MKHQLKHKTHREELSDAQRQFLSFGTKIFDHETLPESWRIAENIEQDWHNHKDEVIGSILCGDIYVPEGRHPYGHYWFEEPPASWPPDLFALEFYMTAYWRNFKWEDCPLEQHPDNTGKLQWVKSFTHRMFTPIDRTKK